MLSPTAPSSSSGSDGDIPNILPPAYIQQVVDNERAPSILPRLLYDYHITVANGQALHEAANPSRLGAITSEACLKCALFIARRGDLLTKDDLCLIYHGSYRCSHYATQNHDCLEIHCDMLREAVNLLFELCFRYFYNKDSKVHLHAVEVRPGLL